ncbi:MAG: ECF transporter S component [Oscillospiraceae bacterium]|nr:ECF transporter S component [Oscillospiraceae bacterium]
MTTAATNKKFDTRKLVLLALLTAIVVVLQLLAWLIPVYPFRLNLILIPVVIGAALISPLAGAWLGLVFGFIVLVTDAAIFLAFDPLATIIVILARGILFGLSAGFVYKLFANRNKTLAVISAAIVAPIVNTGIFVLGLYIFFIPLVMEFGVFFGFADSASIIFLGLVGINFPIEFAVNLILSPVIVRLVQLRQDKKMFTN